MPDKIKNELIDSLIEELKEIKQNGKDIQISIIPDMVNKSRHIDGTIIAQKNININILYKQKYTRNEYEIADTWKPYRKRR